MTSSERPPSSLSSKFAEAVPFHEGADCGTIVWVVDAIDAPPDEDLGSAQEAISVGEYMRADKDVAQPFDRLARWESIKGCVIECVAKLSDTLRQISSLLGACSPFQDGSRFALEKRLDHLFCSATRFAIPTEQFCEYSRTSAVVA